MNPGAFNLTYLSFCLAKSKDSSWNPQNKQISKLTLLFEFGPVEAEILSKIKLPSFLVDTVYYSIRVFSKGCF